MWNNEAIIHQEMRDRVKTLANEKGGRRKLADEMAVSYDFICDICDGRYFPPIDLFELRFGPLKSAKKEFQTQIEEKKEEEKLLKADLPITIKCPEFSTLVELMGKLGYSVRIVVER